MERRRVYIVSTRTTTGKIGRQKAFVFNPSVASITQERRFRRRLKRWRFLFRFF